jgi:hypothetical protein
MQRFFPVVVEDQHGVHAGLADQQLRLEVAMAVAHPDALQLIFIQVARHPLGQRRVVDQSGQIASGKPGFFIQQHGS